MIKNHITSYAQMRVQLGITQEQLASTLCISVSLVKAFETGRRKIPAAALAYMHEMEALVRKMPRQNMDQQPAKGAYPRLNLNNRVPHTTRKNSKVDTNRISIAMRLPDLTAFTATPTRIRLMTTVEIQQQLDQLLTQQQIFACQLQYLQLEKQQAIAHASRIDACLGGSQNLIDCYGQIRANAVNKKTARLYEGKQLLEKIKSAGLRVKQYDFNETEMIKRNAVINALTHDLLSIDLTIIKLKRALLELEVIGRSREMGLMKEAA